MILQLYEIWEKYCYSIDIIPYGKAMVRVACCTHTARRFSYFLSQVRGITSLQPSHNGDSVAVPVHVYYNYSYAIIAQFGN